MFLNIPARPRRVAAAPAGSAPADKNFARRILTIGTCY
jgi:hypothetical protein